MAKCRPAAGSIAKIMESITICTEKLGWPEFNPSPPPPREERRKLFNIHARKKIVCQICRI